MLSNEQIERLPERICERLRRVNTECLKSIGKVVREIGELRPSDIHKLQRMYAYGASGRELAEKLAKAAEADIKEIYELFDLAAKENYAYAEPFYRLKNKPFIPYHENSELQAYVRAQAKQTAGRYVKLVRQSAFKSLDGNKYRRLYDTYTDVIDLAVTRVSMGVTDYKSAMRSCIRSLADSGIRTVDYETGYSKRLDTAVRQSILHGVKECSQLLADFTGEAFGADGYEISYHANPRESHADMAGRQYARGKARSINGVYYPSFSEIENLLAEPNCLHFKYSVILGASEQAYSKEELEDLKAADRKSIYFEGREYTKYDASQLQRRIEAEARRQKDREIIAKASGDTDMREKAQLRINQLKEKYARLSEALGISTKPERMSVRGFRSVKLPEKSLTKINNDAIIKEIKELGIKGEINPIPNKIDLVGFVFDDKHINKERKHNVVLKEAESCIRDAKISIITWNGRFEKYISEHGAAYVDHENKVIRTAFLRNEFDEKIKKILEVLKKYGR